MACLVSMVCPLRFVLVGASAIVAILAVAYTRLSTEDPKERASATSKRVSTTPVLVALTCCMSALTSPFSFSSVQDSDVGRLFLAVQQEQSIWRTVLDMFTGRYLWQTYLDWRDSPATHEDGMTTQPGKQA